MWETPPHGLGSWTGKRKLAMSLNVSPHPDYSAMSPPVSSHHHGNFPAMMDYCESE